MSLSIVPMTGAYLQAMQYQPAGMNTSSQASQLSATQSSAIVGQPVTTRLSNGATAYLQQAAMQQESSLTLLFPLDPNLAGIQEMLPGLLLKGSYNTKAFVDQCLARGIVLAASTTDDKLVLDLSGPAGKETELIQAALQLLTKPEVEPATFNKLRQDLIEDIQKSEAEPEVPLFNQVMKALYGEAHPYAKNGKEMIAELAQLNPIKVMNIYEQLVKAPHLGQVLMVSPQPVETQQALLDQAIQQLGWYSSPYAQGVTGTAPPFPQARGAAGPILIPNHTVERANIVQAWRAPAFGDPDYPAFCLLRKILGGMTTHSFFKTLRTDNGLVYSTQQSYGSHKQGGSYKVLAEVDFDKVGQALQGMNYVIQGILNGPITEEDLDMMKREYLLELRQDLQSSDGIASISLPWVANDMRPKHPSDLEAEIKRVTPEAIKRVAQRMFNLQNGYQVTAITAPPEVLAQWFGAQQSRPCRT